MSVRWWLPLNMLAWTLTMPLLSLGMRYLDERRILTMSGPVVAAGAIALLLWAVFMYVKGIPAASDLSRRAGYFLVFLITMTLLGAGGLWLAFLVVVAVYGL